MTPAQIVATVEQSGGQIELANPGQLRVLAPSTILSADFKAAVVQHKAELLALLREPVTSEQHLLRECRWPPTVPVCDFLIGYASEDCKRCGASWYEHYGFDTPS